MFRNSISQDRRSRHFNLVCDPHPTSKKEVVCEPLSTCDTAFGGFRIVNTAPAPNFSLIVGTTPTNLTSNNSDIFIRTTSFSIDYIKPTVTQAATLVNKRAGKFMVNFDANVTSLLGTGRLYATIYVNGVAVQGFDNFVDIVPGVNENFSINGHLSLKVKSMVEVKFHCTPGSIKVGFNELSMNLNFV